MAKRRYQELSVVLRQGFCRCGKNYRGHPTCGSCGVLIHNDKRYCTLPNSDLLVGYVTVGNVCYNCKQEDKAQKKRKVKYQKRMAIQRRATRAYRQRNLEEMRQKEREIAKRDGQKRWQAIKMKLAHSPVERQKRREANRAWRKAHPGYDSTAARLARKQKRETLTNEAQPEASETL